ncbi:MAG: hypothetical protein LBS40_05260 [Burkholderiales bacterium]|nr:hypothetical protein [Burkholderiales bacterium]
MRYLSYLLTFSLAGALLLLAGCASAPPAGKESASSAVQETREDMVARRSKEFWDARISKDHEKAYGYLSSGSKATLSLPGFMSKTVVQFRALEVDNISCENEFCYVNGTLVYDHPKMRGIRTPSKDIWIFEENIPMYVFPQ